MEELGNDLKSEQNRALDSLVEGLTNSDNNPNNFLEKINTIRQIIRNPNKEDRAAANQALDALVQELANNGALQEKEEAVSQIRSAIKG